MTRTAGLLLLALIAAATLLISPASAARQFPETGYTVINDRFLDYFDKRGGVRTLGYPISREFDLLGTRVQFFQRAVLQAGSDGSVGLMNILDEGLLPYTQINGSSFPAPDPALIAAAPSPADPSYASQALAFVRAFAPDEWEGMKVNFFSTFSSTVSMADAFPTGGGDEALLPLINLEIWGLPTSRPAYDPANRNFVYVRFQRGIMHYDRTTGLTQGILIGDYLKSVITGSNLPSDLEAQARAGRLYRQYDNARPEGVARPEVLPGSNLFAAFETDGVIVPTPAPVVPTPVPTSAPVPPTATTTATAVPAPPAPVATPSAIAVVGTSWYVEHINRALAILSARAPGYYSIVRQYVYRVDSDTTVSRVDMPSRTMLITESDVFPSDWRTFTENQAEWTAGLMVHHATHIEQAAQGRAFTGPDAEREARLRQRDALAQIETTRPGGQLSGYIQDVLTGKEATIGEWEAPRKPLPTPTATPEVD